jgi:tRNA-dihydrouridine synthase C
MLRPDHPALILAPMEGVTDAPMRALQGEIGAFSFAVSEFLRVSIVPIPGKVFRREVPELNRGAATPTGLPVVVQILGGHAGRMAESAATACRAGATAIDINFGCPAPTVNRHDGGASLLRHPDRIREIVREVRWAVPPEIPVSAKMRLGWDDIDAVHLNADMATEGGASWITIHARTKVQNYKPPVFWLPIGEVRARLGIPVIANGDIWTLDDFRRCQEMTGSQHYMLGRSALARPELSWQIAKVLGLTTQTPPALDWLRLTSRFLYWLDAYGKGSPHYAMVRMKQWLNFAGSFGEFAHFDTLKKIKTEPEFMAELRRVSEPALAAV